MKLYFVTICIKIIWFFFQTKSCNEPDFCRELDHEGGVLVQDVELELHPIVLKIAHATCGSLKFSYTSYCVFDCKNRIILFY